MLTTILNWLSEEILQFVLTCNFKTTKSRKPILKCTKMFFFSQKSSLDKQHTFKQAKLVLGGPKKTHQLAGLKNHRITILVCKAEQNYVYLSLSNPNSNYFQFFPWPNQKFIFSRVLWNIFRFSLFLKNRSKEVGLETICLRPHLSSAIIMCDVWKSIHNP